MVSTDRAARMRARRSTGRAAGGRRTGNSAMLLRGGDGGRGSLAQRLAQERQRLRALLGEVLGAGLDADPAVVAHAAEVVEEAGVVELAGVHREDALVGVGDVEVFDVVA